MYVDFIYHACINQQMHTYENCSAVYILYFILSIYMLRVHSRKAGLELGLPTVHSELDKRATDGQIHSKITPSYVTIFERKS